MANGRRKKVPSIGKHRSFALSYHVADVALMAWNFISFSKYIKYYCP